MTPNQTAILMWRQLLLEMGSSATMKSAGPAGQHATRRVRQLRELYFKLLTELRISSLIEIGAMHAETSRRFLEENAGGKAVAYEAAPANYRKAVANALPARMSMINAAIGASSGHVKFFVPQDERLEQWASIRKRLEKSVPVTEIMVPMVTLDEAALTASFITQNRDIALWIDVEGAGLEVLSSGTKTLQANVAILYIELCDTDVYENGGTALEVLGLLASLGFMPVARDNQFKGAWNLLAVHETSYLAARQTTGAWLYANTAIPIPAGDK